jgi:hypothetical protein
VDRLITEEMFLCRCGKCGQKTKPVPELVADIQSIQSKIPFALEITSGVRCKEHNAAIGGSTGSRHISGEACDIRVSDSQSAYTLLWWAMSRQNLRFFELCPKHLHVDVRHGAKRIIVGAVSR